MAIKRADRDAVEGAVLRYAAELRRAHPEVLRVIWFGSWITGTPTPGSDVDLCVVLRSSDRPFRDRIPDFLPASFPVGIDLFPATEEEIEALPERSPGLAAAIALGREV